MIELFILVEYLWTYMRNNQKPRSSALRKQSGKCRFISLLIKVSSPMSLDQFYKEL